MVEITEAVRLEGDFDSNLIAPEGRHKRQVKQRVKLTKPQQTNRRNLARWVHGRLERWPDLNDATIPATVSCRGCENRAVAGPAPGPWLSIMTDGMWRTQSRSVISKTRSATKRLDI